MYIENLYDRFLVARWTYLMGEPILSDIEYDKLEKEFKQIYPYDIHARQGWSFDECPVEQLRKYNLESLICNPVMGYMAESIYSINNKEEYNMTFARLNKKSRLSFKIDGWNTRVSYFNGRIVKVESRGRSGNNLSLNHIANLFPKEIPIKGRVAVTGEVSIPNSKWSNFKSVTGNTDQRASVRTAYAKEMIDYLSFLAFNIFIEDGGEILDSYELLNDLGFETPRYVWVSSKEELDARVKYMSYINRGYDYLTDGLVIENEDYQYAIRLGGWEEHSMHSFVTGYEENQGMYGVFLNVCCHPIEVEGKTFSNISINNINAITSNNLRVGYPIAFNLRSSANVVIDSTETARLQKVWDGKLEEYKNMILSKNRKSEV